MGQIETKPVGDAASNWQQGAQARAQLYKQRAMAAGNRWAQDTAAAAPNFQTAVTSGNIGTRFANGVSRAGAGRYTQGINAKGDRYSGGIAASGDRYSAGVSPYIQALNGFDPGDRGPRGDPRNYNRVQAVGSRLHDLRLATLSAGR